MENIVGINREKMKNTILKLYTYRDKINEILNNAQLLVDDTKSYYISDDGDLFRESFNKFFSNKKIILENVKSYCTDLENVMARFDQNQMKAIDIFRT